MPSQSAVQPFTPAPSTVTTNATEASGVRLPLPGDDRRPNAAGYGAEARSSGSDALREEANEAVANATDAAFAASDAVRDASAEIADVAKEALRAATNALSAQAAELAASVKDELEATAEVQKERGAEAIHRVAAAVRTAAQELEGSSPQVARQIRAAAQSVDSLSDSIHGKTVGELFSAATDFARSQPAAFFAGAVIAGFAFSRFLRSSSEPAHKPEMRDQNRQSPMTSSPGISPSAPPMATF
jgi:hypothetical protein